MRAPRPEIGLEHLENVVTLSQARKAWQKSRSALICAINTGKITARLIGRDWLIALPSIKRYYGEPKRPLDRL